MTVAIVVCDACGLDALNSLLLSYTTVTVVLLMFDRFKHVFFLYIIYFFNIK